jgi:hypothetical protein
LYRNDFEGPKVPVTGSISCPPISFTPVNTYYVTSKHQFTQVRTVETFLIRASLWNSSTTYNDPEGKGGNYSLCMANKGLENDLLGLIYNVQHSAFINVGNGYLFN